MPCELSGSDIKPSEEAKYRDQSILKEKYQTSSIISSENDNLEVFYSFSPYGGERVEIIL